MGMYDDVNFEMDCPICGTRVDGFQSKDGACNLDTVEPDGLLNFYSICPNPDCGAWIELTRYPAEPRETPLTLEEVQALGFSLYYHEHPAKQADPESTEPLSTEPLSTEPLSTEPLSTEPLSTEPLSTEPLSTEPFSP